MDERSQQQWFRSQPEAETEQVTALLEVSRSVHEGGDLRTTLDTIAEAATRVVAATSASVLMVETPKSLRLAGSYGLTPEYEEFLSSRFIVEGRGQAGWALQAGRTVTIGDMDNHPYTRRAYAAAWRRFAAIQGYRSMAAAPLTFHDETLGVLNVYRAHVGEWSDRQVDLLTAFGQHAAGAIATAQLLDVRARHVAALTRVVGALREQTHEYANRVHAIHGLLALGAYDAAQEFVDELTVTHHRTYSATVDSIGDPIIAALVLAEMNLARQRGIELTLHAESALSALPVAADRCRRGDGGRQPARQRDRRRRPDGAGPPPGRAAPGRGRRPADHHGARLRRRAAGDRDGPALQRAASRPRTTTPGSA